ncbi:MAG: hypothetical protein K2O10_02975, partial [Muribaculaceae bacterium]|nr:hypothetical protein [Muribaculaceae bacterium]
LTINDVNQTFSTASDNLEYVYTNPQITDQVTIGTVATTGADKRAFVKSLIIIYDEVETVATPTFTPYGGEVEANSDITIDCATEGATLHYAWNNEDAAELIGNLVQAQQGTLSVYATKEGMQQSETASATFTIKTPSGVAPSAPVVTTDNDTEIGNYGEVTLPYGTHITVTSTGADMLSVEINDIKTSSDGDTYEFALFEDVICQFYGSNYFGFSDYITFTAQVAKADLLVKFDGTEVLAGQTYTVRPGTVVTLTTTTGTKLGIYDEEFNEVVTDEGKYLEYTINDDCNLTFEASTPATGTSTTIDEVVFAVKQPVTYGDFTLVTATDQVIAEDYYTLVYTDDKTGESSVMTRTQTGSGNKYLSGEAVTITDGVFSSTEESMIFVLEDIDGKQYLRTENFGETPKYFQGRTGSGNNEIVLVDTPDNTCEIAVTIDENNLAEILFTNATYTSKNTNYTRSLQFNKSQNWFGLYGSKQGKAALYKKESVVEAPVEAHSDTHFVISATQGTLYVKEYDGLKPDINPSPKAVHTPEEGFVAAEGNTGAKPLS